jgi:rfaE bifunctional protein nucleotidyltransferase chain/domain/rfaE bifunctional protein kinase chain/domain
VPLSAICLHGDSSSVTAIVNDYGIDEMFARQVRAHGRPGDVLVALSTSGTSRNILTAVQAAREIGMTTWGLTGPGPNALGDLCDETVYVDAPTTATVAGDPPGLGAPALRGRRRDARRRAAGDRPGRSVPGAGAMTGGLLVRRPGGGPMTGGPLVVVGDVFLDRDLEGSVRRVAPDAPVAVVEGVTDRKRPGGAGLAAALAGREGRDVVLVAAVGSDAAGDELRALLSAAGVELLDLGMPGDTPQKVRVRSDGHGLLRIDLADEVRPPGAPTAAVADALAGAAAVLVADYGRGVPADDAVRSLLSAAVRRTPVVWDPHPRGATPVDGIRLGTPNQSEAAGLVPEVPGSGLPAATGRARALRERWGATAVSVTLGERGALVVMADGAPLVVPAVAARSGDPCGAGDCFAATAAGALADGALVSEAVASAVAAASAFVAAGGAARVDLTRHPNHEDGLTNHVSGAETEGPTLSRGSRSGTADETVAAVRARGGTVVATGGCFDLLHAGHVAYLEAARSLGDCLVVCLNSDASTRRLKGEGRPLVPEDDRAAVLRSLSCVDAVAIFDEDTPLAVLDRLRPDVFAKGGDYALSDLPEAELLASWGGQAVVLPYLDGRSTTALMKEAVRRANR